MAPYQVLGLAMGMRISEYYGSLWGVIKNDIRPRVEWGAVAFLVGVIGAWMLDASGLAPKGQILTRILVAAIPTVVIVSVYFLVHAVRAPWKVHNGTIESHSKELSEIITQNERRRLAGC